MTGRNRRSSAFIIAAAIVATGLLAPSIVGTAFAHPHLVLTPDKSDHDQMNANPVVLTLGHSNEPSFGAKPGIHDGRHDFELSIEDAATTLPLAGANLTLDRYYFEDIDAFNSASSPQNATEVETGIQLRGVFGEPGVYSVRQIVKEGIYGYRVYGTIDYFGVAQISIDSTVFCTTPSGNTSKFNSPGWVGSFGCVDDIDSLLFPENNSEVRLTVADSDGEQTAQVGTVSDSTSYMLAAGIPATAVAVLFGVRTLRSRNSMKDGPI